MVAPLEPMILGKADRGRPVQSPTVHEFRHIMQACPLTVRGSLDVLKSLLERSDTFLEVLLFGANNPLQLALDTGGVVLPQLPVSLSHDRILALIAAQVDTGRLGREA
jgi:hypothetical protein